MITYADVFAAVYILTIVLAVILTIAGWQG